MSSCSEDTAESSEKPANNKTESIATDADKDKEKPAVNQENTQADTDLTQEITEEPKVLPYINPLTGEGCENDLTAVRPVAVMINNLKEALPQIGISEASIVYEMLEEGGITRLMCLYNDYTDIPEIGSVRSARDYYIDVSDAHDAVFVHAGGSTYAYTALSQRYTNHLDGLYLSQFYRSAERRKTMAKEHTLMVSGSGLAEAIKYRGYRTTSESPSPLVFGADYSKGTVPANNINFYFAIGKTSKPYATVNLDYDEKTATYLKGQYGKPHIDGDDNSQLSFKNVITLTCPMNRIPGDALGCIQVHFTGTGKGTYSVDGTQRDIVWKKSTRSSSYTLYESDGETPLVLAPGKSYIAIVPTGTQINVE